MIHNKHCTHWNANMHVHMQLSANETLLTANSVSISLEFQLKKYTYTLIKHVYYILNDLSLGTCTPPVTHCGWQIVKSKKKKTIMPCYDVQTYGSISVDSIDNTVNGQTYIALYVPLQLHEYMCTYMYIHLCITTTCIYIHALPHKHTFVAVCECFDSVRKE